KQSLLNAKSVAYAPEAASGSHVAKVIERLGIADQMKAKTKPQQAAGRIAQAVADGEAELGLSVTTEFQSIRGVDVVGLLPADLQNYIVLTAGVGSGAKEADAAKALIKFLTAPEATVVLKAKGLERVSP